MKGLTILLSSLIILSLSGCNRGGTATTAGSAQYSFTTIQTGSVEQTISATGSLKPTATVVVRAPVSGTLEQVYVDYNTPVARGQRLAQVNTATLQSNVERQQLAVAQAERRLQQAQEALAEQSTLYSRNLVAKSAVTTAQNTVDDAQTTLDTANTDLSTAKANLAAATITSPIDGIVLVRSVSTGDSVSGGSSSQGTALFTLAQNLTEMQIEASVGETDIASIYVGQAVRFTIEAIPGETFQGTVLNRYLMPSQTNFGSGSVNTYTIIISADNSEEKMYPNMTCSLTFIVEQNSGVLVVNASALRYSPSWMTDAQITAAQTSAANAGNAPSAGTTQDAATARSGSAPSSGNSNGNSGGIGGLISDFTNSATSSAARSMGGGNTMNRNFGGWGGGNSGENTGTTWTTRYLWYLDDYNNLTCLAVQAGTSNGSQTMIQALPNSSISLEGMQVVASERVSR
jgi:HlyD family secretion protein